MSNRITRGRGQRRSRRPLAPPPPSPPTPEEVCRAVTRAALAHVPAALNPTVYELAHVYGDSYFGSGCAWGNVDFSANCRLSAEVVDTGFLRGPKAIEVVDPTKPARFAARGGDYIGDDERRWGEAAEWDPSAGRWAPVPQVWREKRPARQAWVNAADSEEES